MGSLLQGKHLPNPIYYFPLVCVYGMLQGKHFPTQFIISLLLVATKLSVHRSSHRHIFSQRFITCQHCLVMNKADILSCHAKQQPINYIVSNRMLRHGKGRHCYLRNKRIQLIMYSCFFKPHSLLHDSSP